MEAVEDLLTPVFENGKLLVEYNLESIRNRAEIVVPEMSQASIN
jgi:hypothetical protein